MFSSSGNSFFNISRISFTVFLPSQFCHTVVPILSILALNIFSFLINLQKDLPSLLLNFGTFISTTPSEVRFQSNSAFFGIKPRNSSTVGGLVFCFLFFAEKNLDSGFIEYLQMDDGRIAGCYQRNITVPARRNAGDRQAGLC